MGIDYSANYGVGYEVEEGESIADTEELEDGLIEYLYCEADSERFESFETGNAYSGEIDGVYLSIKTPFKDGLDLTSAKAELDKEVERLGLDVVGEFGEIGGLYVC